jgi:hypothetical protein
MAMRELFERFVDEAPVCVMVRIAMENVLSPRRLDRIFEKHAAVQYQRELLFSSLVDLMSLVVTRVHPAVHAAYQRRRTEIPVSVRALYDKLDGVEPQVSQALVRETAADLKTVIDCLGTPGEAPLPGYRLRILDGNHLRASQRRLKVLRDQGAALPGLTLCLLDPQRRLIEDVVCCEDGHTQECTLVEPLLEKAGAGDVFVTDRHFCTSGMLFGLARRQASFLTRQHANRPPVRLSGRRRRVGRSETGVVYEQAAVATNPQTGEELAVRRITVELFRPTRDKDAVIHLLTNLPAEAADALRVAELYRTRWRIETAFQELTMHLHCEINALAYPKAALFGFSVAVVCYNLLAVVTAALKATHGPETIAENLSNYYLTEEIGATSRGMMIALPPRCWRRFQSLDAPQLAAELKRVAARLRLALYQKHPRRSKRRSSGKPYTGTRHVATARLLRHAKQQE